MRGISKLWVQVLRKSEDKSESRSDPLDLSSPSATAATAPANKFGRIVKLDLSWKRSCDDKSGMEPPEKRLDRTEKKAEKKSKTKENLSAQLPFTNTEDLTDNFYNSTLDDESAIRRPD